MSTTTHDVPPTGDRVRRRRVLAAVLLGGGLLAAGAVWYRWPEPAPDIPAIDLTDLDPDAARAIEVAQGEVRRYPREATAWGQLGMVLFVHGLREPARVCAARAAELDPRDRRWPYFEGLSLLLGDPEAAIDCFRRAADLPGRDVTPVLRLAEALLDQGHLDEAEAAFRRVLRAEPEQPRANLGLGQVLSTRDDPRAALPYLNRAAAHFLSRRAAQVALAEVYLRLGDTGAAAAAQRRAAELPRDPPWPDPIYAQAERLQVGESVVVIRAQQTLARGQGAAAVAMLEAYVETHPNADRAYRELAQTCLQLRDGPGTERAARRFVALKPDAPVGHFLLGAALHLKKDYRGAAECFRKAAELKPDYALAYYNEGQCLRELGDRAGAARAFRAALRNQPELASAHRNLGELLARDGKDAEAIKHLRQAVRLAPDDRQAAGLLAQLEARAGRPDKP
jgi:tetratricopeptide (TPR) repeat protein